LERPVSTGRSAQALAAAIALACGLAAACTSVEVADGPASAADGHATTAQAEWTENGQVATEMEGKADGMQSEPTNAPLPTASPLAEPVQEGAAGTAAESTSEPAGSIAVDGSLTTRYIGRWSGGDHDQDIYSLLSATIGDPDHDPYSGYILGRVSKDLDGNSGGETSPFFSLEDTYDNSVNGHLYEAYVDFHDTGLDLMRVGRQTTIETPAYARFDGASLETKPDGNDKRQFGVYGGQTTHEFESSPQGDSVYGAYVTNRMWKGGRTRIDYMHLDDEQQLGTENNDLWAAQVQQQFGRDLNIKGGYSLLENSPREFDTRATWAPPESGWLVQTSYYALLQTEGVLAEELDPFTSSLQQYFPYSLSRLLVSKTFDEGYSVEGGADLRRVDDTGDQGEFNRDYDRYHLTGTIDDWCLPGLALALTGDYWTSDGSDTNSWGLDLTREVSETLRASFGSYYQLYKNDFLLDQERDDVRTFYATIRYRPDKRLTWAFGLEHEDNSLDNMDTLTAKATWNF
jgi:hypothetical protein